MRHELHIHQGETFEYTWPTVDNEAGNPVDLTGYTAKIALKEHRDLDETLAEWTSGAELTLNSDGTIDIKLDASTTAGLSFREVVYDIRLVDGAGEVSYPFWGHITLEKSVTTS